MRDKLLILVLLLSLLSACSSEPTPTIAPSPTPRATAAIGEPYPVLPYPIGPGGSSTEAESTPAKPIPFVPTATLDPINSPVIISLVTYEEGLETIYVTNISAKPQEITGFTLLIPDSTEHKNISRTTLQPGTSLKIYNGPEAKNQTDGVIWRDQPVMQAIGESIYLLNRAGRLIWSYSRSD